MKAEARPPAPGWPLDELARAGRENLDRAHVERDDGTMDARAAEEVEFLRSWGLGASSIVVDLGAGTGQFALAAAAVCRRVVAVDVSPVMRQRLRTEIDDAALGNVDIVDAGFLTYDHTGARPTSPTPVTPFILCLTSGR